MPILAVNSSEANVNQQHSNISQFGTKWCGWLWSAILVKERQIHNTLRPRQNGRQFPDNNFKCIFSNENIQMLIKISLKFVPKGPINNIPPLVLIMAWRWAGDKPLFEPMMITLLTHLCVTRPQWLNANHIYFLPNKFHRRNFLFPSTRCQINKI